MAASTKELLIKLTLQNEQLLKANKATQKSFTNTEKKGKDLGKGLNNLKTRFFALGAVITIALGSLRKVLKLFGEQEKAQKTLAAAMKQAGTFTEAAFKENLKYASSLQKVTKFGDETILSVQKILTNFGLEGEALKDLTKATLDLASAKGMDLTSAADLVARSVGSSTSALSRYGIIIEGAAGSTERANSAVENISKLFGGAAQAEAQTFSGRVQQLQNRIGDIGENIGEKFIPIIEKLINIFESMSESAQSTTVVAAGLIPVVIGLYVALGPIALVLTAASIAAGAFALSLSDVNEELIENNELSKNLNNEIDKEIAKTGDQKKINEIKIKQNKELIDQKREDIKQAEKFIGVTNVITGQTLTENKFNKEKAKILKQINALEKQNQDLKNGGIVLKNQAITLTKEEITTLDELAKKQNDTDEAKLESLNKLLEKIKGDAEQEKIIQEELTNIKNEQKDREMAKELELFELQKQIGTERLTLEKQAADLRQQWALQSFTGIINAGSNFANAIGAQIKARSKDEKEGAIKAAKIARVTAVFGKLSSIAQVIIQGRLGALAALANPNPLIPFAVKAARAASIRVSTGLSVAAIAATPLPEIPKFRKGGLISGLPGGFNGEDGIIAAQNGESVLTKQATLDLGADTINALNNGQSVPASNISITVLDGRNAVDILDDYFKTQGTSERGLSL